MGFGWIIVVFEGNVLGEKDLRGEVRKEEWKWREEASVISHTLQFELSYECEAMEWNSPQ